jgi:hypothetical protein
LGDGCEETWPSATTASREELAAMKSIIALSVFVLSLSTLGGCATMHDSTSMAQSKSAYDEVYIARVEQEAIKYGADVHWVNPPPKHASNPK